LRLTKFQTTIQCPRKPPHSLLTCASISVWKWERNDLVPMFFLIETYIPVEENLGIFKVYKPISPVIYQPRIATNATIMNLWPLWLQAKFIWQSLIFLLLQNDSQKSKIQDFEQFSNCCKTLAPVFHVSRILRLWLWCIMFGWYLNKFW